MELAFVHGKQYDNADATFKVIFTGVRLGLQQYRVGITINGENYNGTYVVHLDEGSSHKFVIKIKYGKEPFKRLDIYCTDAVDLGDKISTYSEFGFDHFRLE